MMKAFGGCMLLTASLLFLSKGAAASHSEDKSGNGSYVDPNSIFPWEILGEMMKQGASHSWETWTSRWMNTYGKGEYVDPNYQIAVADAELKDYIDTQVVDIDLVALEQFEFAHTAHTQCLSNNTVKEACATAFDEALKGVNQYLKEDIVVAKGYVDTGLGINVKKTQRKLDWLRKEGITPEKQAGLEGIIEDFESSKVRLNQTRESTVSCEIGGMEEGEFTNKNFDDIREAFEAMINMALIRDKKDVYFNNLTWGDEANVTRVNVTRVRNLGRSSMGVRSRTRLIRGARGTSGCKVCRRYKVRDNMVGEKRRRLPGRRWRVPRPSFENKYSEHQSKYNKHKSKYSEHQSQSKYSSTQGENSKMKSTSTSTSMESTENENKMIAFWEEMMKKAAVKSDVCTEGFKIEYVDGSLAMLVAMKVGSQVDNEDFSVSCCFKIE